MNPDQISSLLRQALSPINSRLAALESRGRGQSQAAEMDAIQGRRVMFTMVQSQAFTAAQAATSGSNMTFLVSIDGPFVMTHYPLVTWKPTLPSNATNFGRWRPCISYPLPTQQLTTDIIDISYMMTDTGPTRNLQDNFVPGGLISTSDELRPLPRQTKFEPNTTIQFTPYYEAINFNATGTATTGGNLVVALIGYKIITSLGNGG